MSFLCSSLSPCCLVAVAVVRSFKICPKESRKAEKKEEPRCPLFLASCLPYYIPFALNLLSQVGRQIKTWEGSCSI